MECKGTAELHCCWLEGTQCKHLRFNVAGREIACGLLLDYGDWDSVLDSPEYQRDVAPILEKYNYTCRDWPVEGKDKCNDCGAGC